MIIAPAGLICSKCHHWYKTENRFPATKITSFTKADEVREMGRSFIVPHLLHNTHTHLHAHFVWNTAAASGFTSPVVSDSITSAHVSELTGGVLVGWRSRGTSPLQISLSSRDM